MVLGVKVEERDNGALSVAVNQPWKSVESPACQCDAWGSVGSLFICLLICLFLMLSECFV